MKKDVKLISYTVVCSFAIFGCNSVHLSESEEVAVDFYEAIFVERDVSEAMFFTMQDQPAFKERLQKIVNQEEQGDRETDKVILVPNSSSLNKNEIIFARKDYQDLLTIYLQRKEGKWKVSGISYNPKGGLEQIDELESREIQF